jgi:cytochrome c
MKVRYLVAMILGLSVSASALADDGEVLFKKSGCNVCHAVDQKKVGPSFKSVAAKYATDSAAQATLEQKVRGGGAGSFGAMPMPPTPKSVSDDSIKTIVAWVLKQK